MSEIKITWVERAARKVDLLYGEAIEKNTGLKYGTLCGLSIRDVMDVIEKAYREEQEKVQTNHK
jgi:hypothetical protein